MSDNERSPSIEEFAQLYDKREELQQTIRSASELMRDLLQQGLETADARLAELAVEAEVSAYYVKLGGGVTQAAQELEQVESTLRELGLDEQIEAKRREIEAMSTSPEVKAARYFVELCAVRVEVDDNTPQPPPRPARPEAQGEKPTLTILVDPHYNISVNSKVMSLSRDLKAAGKVGGEAAGRKLKADVITFLAENPQQAFKASEIWVAIRPEMDFDRVAWNIHCKDFFREEFKYKRKPIIKVDKTHPRLLHYSLEDFNLSVDRTDKPLNIKDESVFTLPNNREVAGKGGKLLHMLAGASKERPVVDDMVYELYTDEEKSALEDPKNVLSGLVSAARQRIKGTNLNIVRVLTDKKDLETNRRRPGYYMETIELPQEPLTLQEAAVLAGFLHHYQGRLNEKGIEPMPESIFEALNRRVAETYANGEKTEEHLHQLRSRVFRKAIALVGDPEALESTIANLDLQNDPRYDLLIHLLSYTNEDQAAYIQQLLDASSDLQVTFDAGRRRGFAIVEIKARRVGEGGEEL